MQDEYRSIAKHYRKEPHSERQIILMANGMLKSTLPLFYTPYLSNLLLSLTVLAYFNYLLHTQEVLSHPILLLPVLGSVSP